MQAGQRRGVGMVSDVRVHAPHTLWLAEVGLWRCLCERRRVHWSHIRGFWEVSDQGGHGQIVVARQYRWYCCATVGRGLASEW